MPKSSNTEAAIVLACSPAWRSWSNRLAKFARLPRAAVIDQAMVSFASQIGFPEAAPPRNVGHATERSAQS